VYQRNLSLSEAENICINCKTLICENLHSPHLIVKRLFGSATFLINDKVMQSENSPGKGGEKSPGERLEEARAVDFEEVQTC